MFFRYIKNLIRLMQLPRNDRRVVIYSEGESYWTHLEGIANTLIQEKISFCYISSGKNDPGLRLKDPNCHTYLIDKGWIRNWLFENIDTDVMILTIPDLHQYQVKRSRHRVHYIYVQHSLVSLHMVYRPGAFHHYDTLCCAGPHHWEEANRMKQVEKLDHMQLLKHGYGRLDAITQALTSEQQVVCENRKTQHVLLAPSWGEHGTMETIGDAVVDILLSNKFKVTLRPHPQSFLLAKEKIDAIEKKHRRNPLFKLEKNVSGWDSLQSADLMISDWSGAALDYAFAFEKPVLFLDVPRKINNPNYEHLGIEPFEVAVRDRIGNVLSAADIDKLPEHIKSLTQSDFQSAITAERTQSVYNLGSSDSILAQHVKGLLHAANA